jgi:hypothetical protein
VNRLPIDAPIRAHFDFLFGYIDALFIELDDAEASAGELVEARNTIATISDLIDRAQDELDIDAGDDAEKRLEALLDRLRGMKNGIAAAYGELDKVRL